MSNLFLNVIAEKVLRTARARAYLSAVLNTTEVDFHKLVPNVDAEN